MKSPNAGRRVYVIVRRDTGEIADDADGQLPIFLTEREARRFVSTTSAEEVVEMVLVPKQPRIAAVPGTEGR